MDAREMTEKAKNWQETAENLSEQARDWQETARRTGRVIHEYVHDNAWMSVAIAAALGCAVGLLLSRSRD